MRRYTASPGRYTNTGRRAVGSTVQLDFLGDDFFCFRISAQCLVPLWIHVCVSLPASCIWQSLVRCRSSVFLGHGFQIFPYSAALGSTWIHVLRQSIRLLEVFHTSLVVLCSGMCRVGFTGCDAPRVIFPSLSSGP